jgi:hypothetical protein
LDRLTRFRQIGDSTLSPILGGERPFHLEIAVSACSPLVRNEADYHRIIGESVACPPFSALFPGMETDYINATKGKDVVRPRSRARPAHRYAAVGMLEEVMASLHANNLEASAAESGYDFISGQPRQPVHDATRMVCTPTKSSGSRPSPCASRHTSTASRIRIMSSSRERACEWQPRNAGTVPT